MLAGGLAKDIKSSLSLALLFFFWVFCAAGGGAIRALEVEPTDVPGLGLDLLHCRSYLIWESVSVIEAARATRRKPLLSAFSYIKEQSQDLVTCWCFFALAIAGAFAQLL